MRATKLLLGVAALALVIPLVGCVPGVGSAGTGGATGSQGADGADGSVGAQGPQGLKGATGETGPRGATGAAGPQGPGGALGPQGASGTAGAAGANGTQGTQGMQGVQGIPGPAGAQGSGDSALFYAIMTPDNAAPIGPGGSVEFPRDGPTTSPGTTRLGSDSFLLGVAGVYRVTFDVAVWQAGQLVIVKNGAPLDYTVTGRFGTSSSISLTTLVDAAANDVIAVRTPSSATGGLTATPYSGGSEPSVATLLIELVKAD